MPLRMRSVPWRRWRWRLVPVLKANDGTGTLAQLHACILRFIPLLLLDSFFINPSLNLYDRCIG